MQGRERAIDTRSVRSPQPHNINSQKERREREKQKKTKRERPAEANKKSIGPAHIVIPVLILVQCRVINTRGLNPTSPSPSNTE